MMMMMMMMMTRCNPPSSTQTAMGTAATAVAMGTAAVPGVPAAGKGPAAAASARSLWGQSLTSTAAFAPQEVQPAPPTRPSKYAMAYPRTHTQTSI